MKYKKVPIQAFSHLCCILKRTGQLTQTKINSATSKAKEGTRKPLGQRPQIFLYKLQIFAHAISLFSRAWDMRNCVPQVSRTGLSQAGVEREHSVMLPLRRSIQYSLLKTERTSAKQPLWLAAAVVSLGRQSNLLSKEDPRSKTMCQESILASPASPQAQRRSWSTSVNC